jgi:hypothetical protein
VSARSAWTRTSSTLAPARGASSATTASISRAVRDTEDLALKNAAAARRRPRRSTHEEWSYFLLFFFMVFFFAAGFFVAFFLAAIGAPSSERPFDLEDTC